MLGLWTNGAPSLVLAKERLKHANRFYLQHAREFFRRGDAIVTVGGSAVSIGDLSHPTGSYALCLAPVHIREVYRKLHASILSLVSCGTHLEVAVRLFPGWPPVPHMRDDPLGTQTAR